MAIPYVKQTHTDGVPNQFNAARANQIEQGIFDAHYQPAVRVTHNANQSITTATDTALAFNTEIFDQASNATDTMHDTVTNNSRLTCRYAGVYQINGGVEWAANATGIRQIAIRHSVGSAIIQWQMTNNVGAGVVLRQSISTLYPLAVNEYVELIANQNSGGNLNVNFASASSPTFMMVRVG